MREFTRHAVALRSILPGVWDAVRRSKSRGERPCIAISGLSASGKSSLSQALSNLLTTQGEHVVTVHIDDFVQPRRIRALESLPHLSYWHHTYNVDFVAARVLAPFKADSTEFSVLYKPIDLVRDLPSRHLVYRIRPSSVLILEGATIVRPSTKKFFDCIVYIDVCQATAIRRAIARGSLWPRSGLLWRFFYKFIPVELTHVPGVYGVNTIVLNNSNYHLPYLTSQVVDVVQPLSTSERSGLIRDGL